MSGRKQRPKAQPNPKPQARRIRKEPPVYAAGMPPVGSFVGPSSLTPILVVTVGREMLHHRQRFFTETGTN